MRNVLRYGCKNLASFLLPVVMGYFRKGNAQYNRLTWNGGWWVSMGSCWPSRELKSCTVDRGRTSTRSTSNRKHVHIKDSILFKKLYTDACTEGGFIRQRELLVSHIDEKILRDWFWVGGDASHYILNIDNFTPKVKSMSPVRLCRHDLLELLSKIPVRKSRALQ